MVDCLVDFSLWDKYYESPTNIIGFGRAGEVKKKRAEEKKRKEKKGERKRGKGEKREKKGKEKLKT